MGLLLNVDLTLLDWTICRQVYLVAAYDLAKPFLKKIVFYLVLGWHALVLIQHRQRVVDVGPFGSNLNCLYHY